MTRDSKRCRRTARRYPQGKLEESLRTCGGQLDVVDGAGVLLEELDPLVLLAEPDELESDVELELAELSLLDPSLLVDESLDAVLLAGLFDEPFDESRLSVR
nr:hypothetical protein [Phytoactinopolyspora limicola]